MKRESHTLEEVVAELAKLKARGIFGSIELVFHGHDITTIKKIESFRPGELPPTADSRRDMTT